MGVELTENKKKTSPVYVNFNLVQKNTQQTTKNV